MIEQTVKCKVCNQELLVKQREPGLAGLPLADIPSCPTCNAVRCPRCGGEIRFTYCREPKLMPAGIHCPACNFRSDLYIVI